MEADKRGVLAKFYGAAFASTSLFTNIKHNYMNDSTWDILNGQDKPTLRAAMARRRIQLTERNNKFLNDMEDAGCDPNSIVNLALSIFIPKTYNHNFILEEIIRQGRR